MRNEIREKADRLAQLVKKQAEIRSEAEELKAWFENQAVNDLKDTKKKTVEYWGSHVKVSVGNSETVKPVSMVMVKKLLGEIFPDLVKEETTYRMTEPCKRLFALMYLGNYTEVSLDETIRAITKDEKLQRTLRKKLKG